MATYYYNLFAGTNGTGTPASPFNGTTWPGAAFVAGDQHLFKRGTTGTLAFTCNVSGNVNSLIKFGAWYNADGSDDVTQAKPIINTSVQMMTFGGAKDYIWLDNLDIEAPSMSIANDKSWVFLGTGCKVTNCNIFSNCGCIGIWDKDNVTIDSNTLSGVSHSSANNNQVLAIVNSAAHGTYNIANNTITHLEGGGTTSHAVVCYDNDGASSLTGLVFRNNTVKSNTGNENANQSAIALRILNANGAVVDNNSLQLHQVGCFCAGGAGSMSNAVITNNNCSFNWHFGIACTTATKGFTISGNTCTHNGTSIVNSVLQGYGRGIEMSSAAGQSSCASHTITYNTCCYNYNWGGPADNASEGVGIGLDDGTVNCFVQGNTCTDNQGNGIQIYGGGSFVTFPDTHNYLYANVFRNNCTAAIISRQSGGTFKSGHFNADIGISYMHGAPSIIANSTHAGLTPVGISTDGFCDQFQIGNNIYYFIDHPITTALTPAANDYRNSIFRAPVQKYSQTDVDVNGEALFSALSPAYNGNSDFTTSPGIDSNLRIISTSSNAYHGGVSMSTGPTNPLPWTIVPDHVGTYFFESLPSIGAFEFDGRSNNPGGHDRKRSRGG